MEPTDRKTDEAFTRIFLQYAQAHQTNSKHKNPKLMNPQIGVRVDLNTGIDGEVFVGAQD